MFPSGDARKGYNSFYILAWFIPSEAACDAATPNVPKLPRLAVPPEAGDGVWEELEDADEGISPVTMLLDETFDDLRDELNFFWLVLDD